MLRVTIQILSSLVPGGPPRNLTATPGMTNVTLMWVAPEQPNGNVTYTYEIINSTVIRGMTMELSVTVTDLNFFTNYTFNVTASTSIGSTDPATGMFTTLEGSMTYIYCCANILKLLYVAEFTKMGLYMYTHLILQLHCGITLYAVKLLSCKLVVTSL